jgi:hypothetical protein
MSEKRALISQRSGQGHPCGFLFPDALSREFSFLDFPMPLPDGKARAHATSLLTTTFAFKVRDSSELGTGVPYTGL